MASVRRFKNSKYWFACYTMPDGRRVQQSTKLTVRKDAEKIADQLESATRKKVAESQARRILRDIFRDVHGIEIQGGGIRDYLQGWVKRKKLETADQTAKKYEQITDDFLKFLGQKASRELSDISSREITAYRDEMVKRVAPTTVNNALKVIRVCLGDARREGLIDANPAEIVKTLSKKGKGSTRRCFTVEELKRLLESCDDEWEGLVLFGLYTGQRLGDLAILTWANIHLDRTEIRLISNKTKRQLIIPIAPPLLRFIETLPAGDNPQQPLFPRSYGFAQKHGGTGYISSTFNKVMVNAGLARPHSKGAKKGEKATNDRRDLNDLSFHSLRHTTTSLLKNAGIGSAIVQDIIGHESSAISSHYTHIDESAKRTALDAMPDIFSQTAKRDSEK